MAYMNPIMVELMVPRDEQVAERMAGFYEELGCMVRGSTSSEFFTYVSPEVGAAKPPTIAYWQTLNRAKIAKFVDYPGEEPSMYAKGLRLPELADGVEVCLVVPNNDTVHTIFENGGRLLENHTYILPRDHAGAQEFRFADPFNYSLRVTANPGWEISPAGTNFMKKLGQSDTIATITRSDFRDNWGPYSTRSYNALVDLASANKEFPLQLDEEGNLHGNIANAVEWIKLVKGRSYRSTYVMILERLLSLQRLQGSRTTTIDKGQPRL